MATAVVTGASAGIGRAAAVALAADGYDVALLARGRAGLDAGAKEVEALRRRSLVVQVDTSDAEAMRGAAHRVEEELGPIDVWVNNAFTAVFAPFLEVLPDEFERVTKVTYLGFVNGTRAALEHMTKRNAGTVVQVGSALGYRGIPLQSAYCGAKHAIQGFTEAVRCELDHAGSNVHITSVQMPAVNTPQFGWVLSRLPRDPQPVPPIYQPEFAAQAIVHAARHPERRQYFAGWITAATIAANAVAPGLLDRYLGRTGFDSQQTDEPATARPSNLWEPVDDVDDHGAHGAFDARAHRRDPQWTYTSHRRAILSVATTALSLRALVKRGRR